MITQDNRREKQIASYCDLILHKKRTEHDSIHPTTRDLIEIKSVTKDKGISTARQVHHKKVAKWRKWFWIFAKGPNTDQGMEIRELYIHHPRTLEPFFAECDRKISERIAKGMEMVDFALSHGFEGDVETIRKLIEVGSRLDDPNIQYPLVRSGMKLPVDDPKECQAMILDFLLANPLG